MGVRDFLGAMPVVRRMVPARFSFWRLPQMRKGVLAMASEAPESGVIQQFLDLCQDMRMGAAQTVRFVAWVRNNWELIKQMPEPQFLQLIQSYMKEFQ